MARKPPRTRDNPAPVVTLYGLHAVEAALQNPSRTIRRVAATRNAATRIEHALARSGITPELVEPRTLDRLVPADAVHQGVVAEAGPLPVRDVEDLRDPSDRDRIVVLDKVTDPRNVGAILRAAAAFAASAIVLTRRHRPPESGVLAKAASGGLEHVSIVEVANLARALERLQGFGYWVAGLDSEADGVLEDLDAGRPIALVLGAEGEGLRSLTRERCDGLYRLSVPGPIKSLNVSTAAAVALHSITSR